jgi:hypothetical protein
MRAGGLLPLLTLIVGLAGCSRNSASTSDTYPGPPLPRPDHIFVAYFAIGPEQVRLEQGVTARFVRIAEDRPLEANTLQAIRPLQSALAEGVVSRLKTYGLSAEIATNNTGSGNGLLVQGQIVSINRGKETTRALIGLGSTGTIEVDTQLFELNGPVRPRFLMAFTGQAASGGTPDADRLADAAATRIAAFAVAQGWIRPPVGM